MNVSHDIISKEIAGSIIRGDYEIDENSILKEPLSADDVLPELGTGLGFNAICAAKINGGKVISFEGNPNMIPLIRENMKRNNVSFELSNEILISKNFGDRHLRFSIRLE